MATLNSAIGNLSATVWTPTLAFGGSSTGITYTTHSGYYIQVGQVVFISCLISLTSKGAQTGAATIAGLPVATGTNGPFNSSGACYIDTISFDTNYDQLGLLFNSASSSIALVQFGSGQAAIVADDANFADTSVISFNTFYFIN